MKVGPDAKTVIECLNGLAIALIRVAAVAFCVAIAACGPRPVELGFWLEPLSFESPRIGEPISQAEYRGHREGRAS